MTSATAARKLAASDWTEAAIQTLLSSGIDAVQITRLAGDLGVSRGSFYWHFADRAELLESLLTQWHQLNSRAIKVALSDVDSLSEAILSFFALWMDDAGFSPSLDQAIRDWARLDTAVFALVQQEDKLRISHISRCFERFGFDKREAPVRARVLYFAQIGYYAMHMQESMHERNALLEPYYTSFTGRKLSAKAARQFKQHVEASL